MTTGIDDRTNIEVLLERLSNVQTDVSDIKATVKCIEKRETTFERQYIKENAAVVQRASEAHNRLDSVEQEQKTQRKLITDLQKTIQPLVATNKIISWMGGILGASVLLLIWLLITGQVQLLFR